MTRNAVTVDGESTTNKQGGADASDTDGRHDTVAAAKRKKVLKRDKHRCRTCGSKGTGSGGQAKLHVHHIERDPDELDVHDLENLTTLCRSCHSWLHQQATDEEVPVELTEADAKVLLPHDREILQVLDEIGPAMTSDVCAALSADLSVIAVRERLWTLMGLDNTVEEREQQIVDQDAATGEWGRTGQIANSSRGRIPDDYQTLVKRVADERVRQALDRGCGRETVADVFGIHSRTTWIKQKRARAYGFPLDAVTESGGRPPSSGEEEQARDEGDDGEPDEEAQQRLTLVAEGETDDLGVAGGSNGDESNGSDPGRWASDREVIRDGLQDAMNALESVDSALQEG